MACLVKDSVSPFTYWFFIFSTKVKVVGAGWVLTLPGRTSSFAA